ncbi:MAG: phenylacetic acid degradation protein [SAR86 cluster bacterium]|uniref:Phenylacetic acid degradation protein n=1 Tax=SAR86 cluster bacterium TaxID=2030880 RepID=A0A2A5ACS6_9GAMM|nr:MAG: phenylacetic acid degradation protein [SAR86 cluster bacterium]
MDFEKSFHPFADLLGFEITQCSNGESVCSVEHHIKLNNTNQVVHGGVIYSLADTGMGAALFSMLEKGERCATIEIKITYFRPSGPHKLVCESRVLKKGKRVAMTESDVYCNGELVAKATGSFAMFSMPRDI